MGLLDKLFGKKPAPSADLAAIQMVDAQGRHMVFTREQWRTGILPANLKSMWDDPQQLYPFIAQALNDGFHADVLDAAKHLAEIDPIPSQGTCIYGIALMRNGRNGEAEAVFRSDLEKHGEDGYVLTNLSKLYRDTDRKGLADETLWHALEVDPNQDNALSLYAALENERAGAVAQQEAWRRVATIPGSWRAQLWLARTALEAHNTPEAMEYYDLALSRAPIPVPQDLLVQMSGDLGIHGLTDEAIRLVGPRFQAEIHGFQVGSNLINAYLARGGRAAALNILDQLRAVGRPDWLANIDRWQTEIAKLS